MDIGDVAWRYARLDEAHRKRDDVHRLAVGRDNTADCRHLDVLQRCRVPVNGVSGEQDYPPGRSCRGEQMTSAFAFVSSSRCLHEDIPDLIDLLAGSVQRSTLRSRMTSTLLAAPMDLSSSLSFSSLATSEGIPRSSAATPPARAVAPCQVQSPIPSVRISVLYRGKVSGVPAASASSRAAANVARCCGTAQHRLNCLWDQAARESGQARPPGPRAHEALRQYPSSDCMTCSHSDGTCCIAS